MIRHVCIVVALMTFTACAGIQREVSSMGASSFGSDWIVLQYGFDGTPINCWRLQGAAISNELNSDGIFWVDSTTGHLIHIAGWYNRVQVAHGDFERAARLLGVELNRCVNGKYVK